MRFNERFVYCTVTQPKAKVSAPISSPNPNKPMSFLMKSDYLWAKELGVSPATLQSWLAQVPQGTPFVYWCLTTGKVNEDSYLNWARNYYELSSLNSSYFQQAPDRGWWMQFKSVANWSEAMIPLREWDGTVFIACTDPAHDVKWSFPTKYVLAKASDLKKYWTLLHNDAVTTPTPAATPASAPATKANSTTAKPLDPMEALMQQYGDVTPESATPPELPADEFEAPEGLAPIKMNTPLPPPLASHTEVTSASQVETPAGLSLAHIQPVTPTSTPPLPKQESMWKSAAPTGDDEGSRMIMNLPEAAHAGLDNMGTMIQFPPAPIAKDKFNAESTRHYPEVLNLLKAEFGNGMILQVANDLFKPEVWDESYTPSSSRAKQFWSLSQPSAFRIAYRTKMPYLGHIVNTPLNKDFFAAWGIENAPKCVLIQPLMQNGSVTHFLLAQCDPHKKSHYHLSTGEKISAELLQHLSRGLAKSA